MVSLQQYYCFYLPTIQSLANRTQAMQHAFQYSCDESIDYQNLMITKTLTTKTSIMEKYKSHQLQKSSQKGVSSIFRNMSLIPTDTIVNRDCIRNDNAPPGCCMMPIIPNWCCIIRHFYQKLC